VNLELHSVEGVPPIHPGDDLAALVAGALESLAPKAGDLLVVCQKDA
jgi:F420-0:gamma-glutamyl ligase